MELFRTILASIAVIFFFLALLKECVNKKRRKWWAIALLVLTELAAIWALLRITAGWATVLLAALVIGTILFFLKRRLRRILVLVTVLAVALGTWATGGTTTANANGVCPKKDSVQLVAVHSDAGKTVTSHGKPVCGYCPTQGQKEVIDAKTHKVKVQTDGKTKGEAVCEVVTPPTTTTTTAPSKKDDTISAADAKKVACATLKLMGGMPCKAIKVGPAVNFNKHTEVRGTAAFSKVTLRSPADIARFLNGSTPQSAAARQRVRQALAKFPGEYQRALKGEGYVPIQFSVAVQYFGTTYFANNQVIEEQGARVAPADDILWLFFTRQKMIVPGASIRADCGNEHFSAIVPVTSSTPPAPSISQPPSVPPTPPGPPAPPVTPKELKNCRGKDANANTAKKLCDPTKVYMKRPVVIHRKDPGRSTGVKKAGTVSTTRKKQVASDTPAPDVGSEDGPSTPVGVTKPPTTTPDTVPAPVHDPCGGDPNCGGLH